MSSSQSSSVGHRTERLVGDQFETQISKFREIQSHSSESEQIKIFRERQREQILGDCQTVIRKHEFQADYDRRSIQKFNEINDRVRENYRAHQGDERPSTRSSTFFTNNFFMNNYLAQNRDLREGHQKSLSEIEELKRFQGSTFDTIGRRILVEDRDTILELTGKIQELQSVFSTHPDPGGMLCRFLGMPSHINWPLDI